MAFGFVLGLIGIIPKPESSSGSIFPIFFILLVFSLPILVRNAAIKKYNGSPRLHVDMDCSFTSEGIECKSLYFTNTHSWNTIVKIEEIGKFLILYTGKDEGEIFHKQQFSSQQLSFIKSKV